ncbi:YdaU family protein [Hydrogenophaga sp.]|uniref:YdaU family protein n=1 Tax=Hydrogenophaga sp. TaxID=1904254 RepID=UPI0035AF7193
MNYYEHHIGDYAEATAHLSLLEDAIYSRLMRKYYASEAPLPTDKRKLARLVGARSKDEVAALDLVLDDFFTLQDDGYHNARCDREIEAFRDGEPERELKRANERNRNNNHRAERARLFKVLTDAGGHAAWNVPIGELRALVRAVAGPAAATPATPATPKTDDLSRPATAPATAPATPDTATQTPDTRHQTPINQREHVEHQQAVGLVFGPGGPARAVEAAQAMTEAGLSDVSASHPKLVALVDAGITVAELRDAAAAAVQGGRGFPWALARAEGQRRDAAQVGALPAAAPAVDPDSRAAIEADGVRFGLGRWEQVDAQGRTVLWTAYASRVKAKRAEASSEVAA